jgi:hypothetical protein
MLVFAALVCVAALIAPIEKTLADKSSTPVTVVNPATSPVPTTVVNFAANPALTSSIDDPGRVPYQFIMNFSPCKTYICLVSSSPVPAGKRLVIQHLSVRGAFSSAATSMEATLGGQGVNGFSGLLSFAPTLITGGFAFVGAQPVLFYIDGGFTFEVSLSATANFAGDSSVVTVTGYLLDCTANQCAPSPPE